MFVLDAATRYSKLFAVTLCAFSLGFCLNCSISAAESGSDSQLNKLEIKLFQHTYAKDNTDARIERLEKLIFGESQKGSSDERLAALVKAVPNLDSAPVAVNDDNKNIAEESKPASTAKANKHAANTSENVAREDVADKSVSVGNYPAVTAMETKLLGRDHSQEPIKERLARLEKKVLGAVSTSDDLSERVDKLKSATGIDIARKPGSANDWIEEDDDMTAQAPSGRGAGDLNFGKRDAYKDMQNSYSSSSTAYAPPRNPFDSAYVPYNRPKNTPKNSGISIKSFGLSQQVTALEHEVFGKSYEHDPLPARVNRLEAAIFPGEKPAVEKALPDRVQILLAKVPIRQEELQHLAKIYNIEPDQSLASADNLNDPAAIQRSRSNLNKIMNSLSNMLSGGMTGGYPMQGGNYIVDPASGLLIDPNTGYVVNPNTGTRYNTRSMSPYGMGNYGYNNYNNNYNSMYPFGSPMGGMGSGFSTGGGGFGFGFR